jgi:hypothetical protein
LLSGIKSVTKLVVWLVKLIFVGLAGKEKKQMKIERTKFEFKNEAKKEMKRKQKKKKEIRERYVKTQG